MPRSLGHFPHIESGIATPGCLALSGEPRTKGHDSGRLLGPMVVEGSEERFFALEEPGRPDRVCLNRVINEQ